MFTLYPLTIIKILVLHCCLEKNHPLLKPNQITSIPQFFFGSTSGQNVKMLSHQGFISFSSWVGLNLKIYLMGQVELGHLGLGHDWTHP